MYTKRVAKTKREEKIKREAHKQSAFENGYNIIAVYERQKREISRSSSGSSDLPAGQAAPAKSEADFTLPRRSKRLSKNKDPYVSSASRKEPPVSDTKRKLVLRKRCTESRSIIKAINERYNKFKKSAVPSGSRAGAESDEFSAKLRSQIVLKNLKNAEDCMLVELKSELLHIDNILIHNKDTTKMSTSSKRKMEVEYEEIPSLTPVPLVPQSKWVYNTPDKQKIKRIVFEDTRPQIIPAVIHTNKKMKVLYNLKEGLAGKINVEKFASGQQVNIDKNFLHPVCEVSVKEENVSFNSFKSQENQFLSNVSEDSIEIKDFNFTMPSLAGAFKKFEAPMDTTSWSSPHNSNDDTMDVENQMLLTCTQRPAKSVKKLARMNSLERRTLSFDDTPKRQQAVLQRHKSEGGFQVDKNEEFTQLNEKSTTAFYGKTAFKDRTNLGPVSMPSTSKGFLAAGRAADVENMYMSDACNNLEHECEFFGDSLWPEMPDMSSPVPYKLYPRK